MSETCRYHFCQQQGGALSLIECTLIEELDSSDEDCERPCTASVRVAAAVVKLCRLTNETLRLLRLSQTTLQARASTTWSSRSRWSLQTVRRSLSSSWLRPARKKRRGPAISARWAWWFRGCRDQELLPSAQDQLSLRFSALTTSDVTAWWPACLRRTPKSLCRTWSSKQQSEESVVSFCSFQAFNKLNIQLFFKWIV